MVNFYHVTKDTSKKGTNFFMAACEERGISYFKIVEKDRTAIEYNNLKVTENDIVYRGVSGRWAKNMERHLLLNECKNVYNQVSFTSTLRSSYHSMLKNNLPIIDSVDFLPRKKADAIAVSEYLGGFPLIMKVSGGTEGIGIIRVDSIQSFNSVLDFLKKDVNAEIRLMKYIEHEYYARVVVVGNKVVATTKDVAPFGDFRTNVRGPRPATDKNINISEEVADASIKAVASIGVKAGGVDVLFTPNNEFYITEVNTPFNFSETQYLTGINIAGNIIDEILI